VYDRETADTWDVAKLEMAIRDADLYRAKVIATECPDLLMSYDTERLTPIHYATGNQRNEFVDMCSDLHGKRVLTYLTERTLANVLMCAITVKNHHVATMCKATIVDGLQLRPV